MHIDSLMSRLMCSLALFLFIFYFVFDRLAKLKAMEETNLSQESNNPGPSIYRM